MATIERVTQRKEKVNCLKNWGKFHKESEV